MFITLLIVTFLIASATSFVVARAFHRSVALILSRIVPEELARAWQRYIGFAIYLVGINGGVRIWELEKYISPVRPEQAPLALNRDRWALEVYRTLIGTLQSIAVALLIFFIVALFAYLIARSIELRAARHATGDVTSGHA